MQIIALRVPERLQDAFAAQQRAHAGDPAAPRHVRDENRHQRDDHPQDDEHGDQITAGVGAAPLDEAHVVHEDQRADMIVTLVDGARDDVQRPLLEAHDRMSVVRGIGGRPAAQ